MIKIEKTMTMEQYKLYVEELTGGKNGCQIQYGGTCHRPDILLRELICDTCELVMYCLCKNKKTSDSTKNKKTKNL